MSDGANAHKRRADANEDNDAFDIQYLTAQQHVQQIENTLEVPPSVSPTPSDAVSAQKLVPQCGALYSCSSSLLSANSTATIEQMRRNAEIDRQIAVDKEEFRLKLLLLGTGESGKSTILKQMRIIHSSGFSNIERLQKRIYIWECLMDSMDGICTAMQQMRIEYKSPARVRDAARVMQLHREKAWLKGIDRETFNCLQQLWSDESVRDTWLNMHTTLQLPDSAKFFYESLERICEPEYLPTDDDILHIRVPTCGAVEMHFFIRDIHFSVFDVGGQRSERRKWIHVFDNVHAIIYVTAINEYDEALREDKKMNRLIESLHLYNQIVNSSFFSNTAMILFLNKTDLFVEKLLRVPLTVCFTSYTGPQEYDACTDYIAKRFTRLNKNTSKNIYAHRTCATDTQKINTILNTCLDIIIDMNLGLMGMQ